jgi:hypothetical protein
MKNVLKMSLLVFCLTAFGFGQQEVSPDHFDGDAPKQPVKAKQGTKNQITKQPASKRGVSTSTKSKKKTTLSARNAGPN